MKRCPECRRDYYDDTLSFCLSDGIPLVYGLYDPGAATAILPAAPGFALSLPPKESATRLQINKSPYESLPSGGSDQIRSIAVLPFENGSGLAELDYLSDGLSESVIDRLSQLGQLKVTSRSSSFKYRDDHPDVKTIAATLGVGLLVLGRVTPTVDGYAIRVDLVDAREDRQIWGRNFIGNASDVQALQADVSGAIAKQILPQLSGNDEQRLARRGTNSTQAYELLLRGRFYLYESRGGLHKESVQKAMGYFEQSIAADPGHAAAYAYISRCYSGLAMNSLLDPAEGMRKAKTAALKAWKLDDTDAEPWYALGRLRTNSWDWAGAELAFKRAIELKPNLAGAHHGYSWLLTVLGRHEESISEARRAKDLDPARVLRDTTIGGCLFYARRYDDAVDQLRKVLELDPAFPGARVGLGYAYAAKGAYDLAVAEYEESTRIVAGINPSIQCFLGAALAKAGHRKKAAAILLKLESSKEYVSPAESAILYSGLNQKDKAFAVLERAYDERDLQMQYLGVDPAFDDLRSDPRFIDLLGRIGLVG